MNCAACNQPARLVKGYASNGALRVWWHCDACDKNAVRPGFCVKLAGSPDSLPLMYDYRTTAEPCVVCGSTAGTEYHHFAPRHIFGDDADKWPGAYLCRICHMLWHKTMTVHVRTCPKCLRDWLDRPADRVYNQSD